MHSHPNPKNIAAQKTVTNAFRCGNVGSAHWAYPASMTPINAATTCEFLIMDRRV
jgi:hypothetical protein